MPGGSSIFTFSLIYGCCRAILTDVAKPIKTKVYTGLPAVTAVKCAECSRPSTRKTKLLNLPIYIDLSFVIISRKCGVFRDFLFYCGLSLYVQFGTNLVLFWYCPEIKKRGQQAPLKYICYFLHLLRLCIRQNVTVQIHCHSKRTMPQDGF